MRITKSVVEKKLERSPEIHFLPYIGPDYGVEGSRVLFVGEANHGRDGDNDNRFYTRNVVEKGIDDAVADRGNDRWVRYIRNTSAMLSGEKYGAADIWDQAAYSVFFQFIYTDPHDNKKDNNEAQLREARAAFFKLLEILQPEYVVLWGAAMEKNHWLLHDDGARVVEPSVPVYAYKKYPRTLIWTCHHPSRDFSYQKEHERWLKVRELGRRGA